MPTDETYGKNKGLTIDERVQTAFPLTGSVKENKMFRNNPASQIPEHSLRYKGMADKKTWYTKKFPSQVARNQTALTSNKMIGFRIFYVNPDSLMGVSKKCRERFKGKANETIDLRNKFLEMPL